MNSDSKLITHLNNIERLYNDLNGIAGGDGELEEKYKKVRDSDKIKIVFTGPYNVGKSTIISALTGDESIAVGNDETTNKNIEYDYKTYTVIDTPGLFTENAQNSEKAYSAVRSADILVCVLDQYAITDSSRQLKDIIEKNPNCIILINKALSTDLQESYLFICERMKKKIIEALGGGTRFKPEIVGNIVCIEAQNYLKGKKTNDKDLQDESHFANFVWALDTRAENYRVYSKALSSLKVLLEYIERRTGELINNWTKREDIREIEERINQIEEEIKRELDNIGSKYRRKISKDYQQACADGAPDENTLMNIISECLQCLDEEVKQALNNKLKEISDNLENEAKSAEGFVLPYILKNRPAPHKNISVNPSAVSDTLRNIIKSAAVKIEDMSKPVKVRGSGIFGGFFKKPGPIGGKGTELYNMLEKYVGPKAAEKIGPRLAKIAGSAGAFTKYAPDIITIAISVGIFAKNMYGDYKDNKNLSEYRIAFENRTSKMISECINYYKNCVTEKIGEAKKENNIIIMRLEKADNERSRMAAKLLSLKSEIETEQKQIETEIESGQKQIENEQKIILQEGNKENE